MNVNKIKVFKDDTEETLKVAPKIQLAKTSPFEALSQNCCIYSFLISLKKATGGTLIKNISTNKFKKEFDTLSPNQKNVYYADGNRLVYTILKNLDMNSYSQLSIQYKDNKILLLLDNKTLSIELLYKARSISISKGKGKGKEILHAHIFEFSYDFQ